MWTLISIFLITILLNTLTLFDLFLYFVLDTCTSVPSSVYAGMTVVILQKNNDAGYYLLQLAYPMTSSAKTFFIDYII